MNGTGYNLTVQAENAFNRIGGEQYLCDEDFSAALGRVKKAIRADGSHTSDYMEHVAELLLMFSAIGVSADPDGDYAYYQTLFFRLKGEHRILTRNELEGKVVRDLYGIFGDYHTPTDYLKRIIDGATAREKFVGDHWREDPLRVRILRQFVKYGAGSLTRINKKITLAPIRENAQRNLGMSGRGRLTYDQMANHLDGTVFDCLIDATGEQRNQAYWLLSLVDDLANGRFASPEKIKTGLYLLAMVYDLPIDPVSDRDHANTIELFTKVYNNHFIRLATQEGLISANGIASLDLGINYKNWMEAIFLYYVGQRELAASQRIEKAYGMIQRIRENREQNGLGEAGPETWEALTEKFRGMWTTAKARTQLLKMDESTFEKFLQDNYRITVARNMSPLTREIRQNTAWKNFCALMKKVQALRDSYEETLRNAASFEKNEPVTASQINSATFYGLWFDSALEIGSTHETDNGQGLIGFLPVSHDREKAEAFCYLLEKVQSIIASVNGDLPVVLDIGSAEQVSRTAMITAAYYAFNEELAVSWGDGDDRLDFLTIFDMFAHYVDPYLEASFYAPLSRSNIFDLLIGFSCYCYQK